jgi:hypothetical protein
MVEGLRRRGSGVEVIELTESSGRPFTLTRLPDRAVVVMDGLALPAIADTVEHEAGRLTIVVLVHLPLAAAIDLDANVGDRIRDEEARALHAASRIVVTSPATIPLLSRYNLPPDSICVVEPGTDRAAACSWL